ncbi:heat shock protein beta-11-like [Rhineura floridana]|uniref:heat shock protein beta-11-like n=1 Tax=Rhineura floridana TaxID=261503 RepID=UPI002AC874AD|nr:heat shock protein beta-11-like [Rhineura floridana]
MASYSRYLLRMLPQRRWPLPGLGPAWLREPQPSYRVLWPPGPSLLDQVANDVERHVQDMERLSRAFWQASPLGAWKREGRRAESVAPGGGKAEPDATFRFSVDVAGFSPEEVAVKLDGRKMTVTAKRQSESEGEEGGYWREHQEVRRETLLPADVDLQAVTCSLASDGQLCIEAPRLASPGNTAKTIPIDVKPADQQIPGASAEEKGRGENPRDP